MNVTKKPALYELNAVASDSKGEPIKRIRETYYSRFFAVEETNEIFRHWHETLYDFEQFTAHIRSSEGGTIAVISYSAII